MFSRLAALALAALALARPWPAGGAEPVPVFALGEANSSAYRLPGLLAFRGVVLALGVQRTLGCADHKSGVHNIVLKRSTDLGASFGPLLTVVDTAAVWGAAERCAGTPSAPCMGGVATNPTVVGDDHTGEVFLFFSHTNHSMEHATHQGSGPVYEYSWVYPDATIPYVSTSTDLGLTFGPPEPLAALGGSSSSLCGLSASGGHGIQLDSGRLLVPGYHVRECTKLSANIVEMAHSWLSSPPPPPGGDRHQRRTWELSTGFGYGVAEQSYVQLFAPKDAQQQQRTGPLPVRATFRVDAPSSCNCTASPSGGTEPPVRKCRRTALSTDEGLSFSEFWDQSSLPDPGCKGGYTRADKFRAIVVGVRQRCFLDSTPSVSLTLKASPLQNDDNAHVRQNVTLSVSLDNGLTYPYKHTVWSGKGGYVDVTMVSETLIGVLYENDGCSMDFQTVDIRKIIGHPVHPAAHAERGLKTDEAGVVPSKARIVQEVELFRSGEGMVRTPQHVP